MPEYDCTDDKWIDGKSSDVTTSALHPLNTLTSLAARDNRSPRLSLVEWFVIGPMVIGLGFMVGVMWP